MISCHTFNLHSLVTNVEHISVSLLALCVSLEKGPFRSFTHFFLIELFIFAIEFYGLFIYLDGNPFLNRYMVCRYFFLFLSVSLQFALGFFYSTEAF